MFCTGNKVLLEELLLIYAYIFFRVFSIFKAGNKNQTNFYITTSFVEDNIIFFPLKYEYYMVVRQGNAFASLGSVSIADCRAIVEIM